MPLISVTRLHLRSSRFFIPFFWFSIRSTLQARRSAGFQRGVLANDRITTFWTITMWADEAAMRAYRVADPHLTAMRKLLEWCDEASVFHYDGDTLPSIDEAFARMRDHGRPSKVNHPSPDHAAGRTTADGRVPRKGLTFSAKR